MRGTAWEKFDSSNGLLGQSLASSFSGGLSFRVEASCEVLQGLVIDEVQHVDQHYDGDQRPV